MASARELTIEVLPLFAKNLDGILAGESVDLLNPNSEIGALLIKVNSIASKRIYSDESAENVQLAGRSVIKGLLSHFGELIKLPEDSFAVLLAGDSREIRRRNLQFDARLFQLLPGGYVEKYRVESRGVEKERRGHLVLGFISGMADDFALKTYRVLEGIRIN